MGIDNDTAQYNWLWMGAFKRYTEKNCNAYINENSWRKNTWKFEIHINEPTNSKRISKVFQPISEENIFWAFPKAMWNKEWKNYEVIC